MMMGLGWSTIIVTRSITERLARYIIGISRRCVPCVSGAAPLLGELIRVPICSTASNLFPVNMYSNYNQNYNKQGSSSSSDVNPYHQPYQGPIYPLPSASSTHSAPVPANAYEYDVGILAQQSVYVPGAMIDKKGGSGGKLAKGGKRTTVLRKGGGKTWEDQTLLEWNPCMTLFSSYLYTVNFRLQRGFDCLSGI